MPEMLLANQSLEFQMSLKPINSAVNGLRIARISIRRPRHTHQPDDDARRAAGDSRGCAGDASRADYVAAIVEHNCLGKPTSATRVLSAQRLSELYALDPDVPLFRIMRNLWRLDERGTAASRVARRTRPRPIARGDGAGSDSAQGWRGVRARPDAPSAPRSRGQSAERRHAGQGRPQRGQLLEPGRPPDRQDLQGPPARAADIRRRRPRAAAGLHLRHAAAKRCLIPTG